MNCPFIIASCSFLASSSSVCSCARSIERQDIAHAEDPAGQALRIERLERVHLLAGADELDRNAGDRPDRERRATAGVAVHLGQDQTADAEALVEGLRQRHRFLTGHGVGDEQDFGRLDRCPGR